MKNKNARKGDENAEKNSKGNIQPIRRHGRQRRDNEPDHHPYHVGEGNGRHRRRKGSEYIL